MYHHCEIVLKGSTPHDILSSGIEAIKDVLVWAVCLLESSVQQKIGVRLCDIEYMQEFDSLTHEV